MLFTRKLWKVKPSPTVPRKFYILNEWLNWQMNTLGSAKLKHLPQLRSILSRWLTAKDNRSQSIKSSIALEVWLTLFDSGIWELTVRRGPAIPSHRSSWTRDRTSLCPNTQQRSPPMHHRITGSRAHRSRYRHTWRETTDGSVLGKSSGRCNSMPLNRSFQVNVWIGSSLASGQDGEPEHQAREGYCWKISEED